jgi:Protein of unknown function (DUF4231)
MNGLEFLRKSLEDEIDRFSVESKKHKRIYRVSQTGIIGLTFATTIAAASGLAFDHVTAKHIQFIVLCLSALTSAISAWVETRHARELWQHERQVYYALIDVRRSLEFEAANGELSRDRLEDYFQKIASILGSSGQKWALIQELKQTQSEVRRD